MKRGPNERTVASGETCFGEVTRVNKTVARTYPVPLPAPLTRRDPVVRGLAKLVNISFFLSWVSKTQPNHWTKRMAITLWHLGPKKLFWTGGPSALSLIF